MKNQSVYASITEIYKKCEEIENYWFAGERFWKSTAIKTVKEENVSLKTDDLGVFLIRDGISEQIISTCKRFYCFNNEAQISGIWDREKKLYRYAIIKNCDQSEGVKRNYISLMDKTKNEIDKTVLFQYAHKIKALPELGENKLHAVINSGNKIWRFGYEPKHG